MAKNPFRYFKTSPEIIQLGVMMYVRFPLSLRNVEDLTHERGIDHCHERVRLWLDHFGPVFGSKIRTKRASYIRQHTQWQWHLDEVFVKINGLQHYLWRAVDHEGEVLESCVTKSRNKQAALTFLKKAMKRYGDPGSQFVIRGRCGAVNPSVCLSLWPKTITTSASLGDCQPSLRHPAHCTYP